MKSTSENHLRRYNRLDRLATTATGQKLCFRSCDQFPRFLKYFMQTYFIGVFANMSHHCIGALCELFLSDRTAARGTADDRKICQQCRCKNLRAAPQTDSRELSRRGADRSDGVQYHTWVTVLVQESGTDPFFYNIECRPHTFEKSCWDTPKPPHLRAQTTKL